MLTFLMSCCSLSLSVLRAVFQVGLEVCGCEGALAAMTQICERLSTIREEKRGAVKTLQDKRQSIDVFTQIAVSEPSLSLHVCAMLTTFTEFNSLHMSIHLYSLSSL